MSKIIHLADLHLSLQDREYTLSVLEEVVALARNKQASHLIMAGDIFDSFADLEALRTDFRSLVSGLPPECATIFIPGNHESLRRGRKSLRSLDLGNIRIMDLEPFSLHGDNDLEFLAIPHQPGYGDYRSWAVPRKKAPTRIAIAHGNVAGMSYAGSEEESGAAALDPDLFLSTDCDYAALGHIHLRRTAKEGHTLLSYPGSARVWRRGETGQRGINLISIKRGAADRNVERFTTEFLALQSAGQYRRYDLPLSLAGETGDLTPEMAQWQGTDWIDIRFSGLVEDEKSVAELERSIRKELGPGVRLLTIDRTDVAVLPGIASQPIARKFLSIWQTEKPHGEHEYQVWLRARELALSEIKSVLENRA